MIHETAIVHPDAELGHGVSVGPYSIIDANVAIGDGTWIGPHVVIRDYVKIGKNNRIFQFSSIGEVPQDLKFNGEVTRLDIGDDNIIREFVTISRGTEMGGGITRVGSNCLLMAYVHVAHDCRVGDFVVMANAATLAGHRSIEDHAIIGGLVAIHQFSRVGAYAMVGGKSAVNKDVAPFLTVAGDRAKPYGLNIVGLKRKGFSANEIRDLKEAYRIIFRSGITLEDALKQTREKFADSPRVQYLIDFISKSQRGICR
jgi:UDP-N-acetylglucosamine acyltransferase